MRRHFFFIHTAMNYAMSKEYFANFPSNLIKSIKCVVIFISRLTEIRMLVISVIFFLFCSVCCIQLEFSVQMKITSNTK